MTSFSSDFYLIVSLRLINLLKSSVFDNWAKAYALKYIEYMSKAI